MPPTPMLKRGAGRSLTLALAACLGAASASAHHSSAMFDRTKVITVTGTVKEFEFTNPHSWIQISSTDPAGKTTEWNIEAEAPSLLIRAGLHPHTIKVGDTITVAAHPLRAGGVMAQLVNVKAADGRLYSPGGNGSLLPPPS